MQFYSAIAEICDAAGRELRDPMGSDLAQRYLISVLRSEPDLPRMERAVLYVLGYLGGRYGNQSAVETFEGFEAAVIGRRRV